MMSVILMLMIISQWIKILMSDGMVIEADGSSPEIFGIVYERSVLMETYVEWCSLACIVRGFKLMQYFEYSSKLSMFSEIVGAAMFDVLFFLLMFIVVMIAYSIGARLVFGVSNEDFNDFQSAILTNFLIIIGSYKIDDITSINTLVVAFYALSLLLVNLVLLNMFVAIIGSHYFEYYTNNAVTGNLGIGSILVRIIYGREIKLIEQDKDEEDVEQTQNCCKKTYKIIKYWLLRTILKKMAFTKKGNIFIIIFYSRG
jgi:hypothetical protein